jgi:quinol---cytochrome c reductase iron-sulfur subunit
VSHDRRVNEAREAARRAEARGQRIVTLAFLASLFSGLALFLLYVAGGQTQLEGLLLTVCLGGIGVGLVVWSHRLMPVPIQEEERHPIRSDDAIRAEVVEALETEGAMGRRTFLMKMLGAALGGLAAALVVPILSLGPAPGRSLFETSWRAGLHLVGLDGKPVNASQLPQGSIATVFPDGAVGAADSQVVLLHVDPTRLQLQGRAAAWAPDGFVAYSKLCTHAGCPVGLYRETSAQLICPCHQSTFDVLDGAKPTAGPAARPLPQLPMRMNGDGTFTALSDFPEPVGPSFWNMYD